MLGALGKSIKKEISFQSVLFYWLIHFINCRNWFFNESRHQTVKDYLQWFLDKFCPQDSLSC